MECLERENEPPIKRSLVYAVVYASGSVASIGVLVFGIRKYVHFKDLTNAALF